MNERELQVLNASRREVAEMRFGNGRVLKPGLRVSVVSRHGTKGTGTIKRLYENKRVPTTMILEMDADTVYATEVERGWPSDEERFKVVGAFGGEIEDVLTLN